MTDEMQGKVALVTGASRGIGRAIAQAYAASGALVAVHYATNAAAAEETVAAITAGGGTAFAVAAQFGESGAIASLVSALDEQLLRRTGSTSIDFLVNNAGGGSYATTADTSEAMYDQTFELNLRTPFFLTRDLLPKLRSGGTIINISSEATRLHLVETVAYGLAKIGLEEFTRCLAKEVGPRGIRVNCIRVGIVETAQSIDYLAIPERRQEIEAATALRRVGRTQDIASMAHALALSPGGFVTGQVIEISGGYLL